MGNWAAASASAWRVEVLHVRHRGLFGHGGSGFLKLGGLGLGCDFPQRQRLLARVVAGGFTVVGEVEEVRRHLALGSSSLRSAVMFTRSVVPLSARPVFCTVHSSSVRSALGAACTVPSLSSFSWWLKDLMGVVGWLESWVAGRHAPGPTKVMNSAHTAADRANSTRSRTCSPGVG